MLLPAFILTFNYLLIIGCPILAVGLKEIIRIATMDELLEVDFTISILRRVIMDDPSMTMEEYIKLEEEKNHRRGPVFNWETTTYEKIRVDDDFHDLRSVETEFPAIVINDTFAS
ncbi:hypothetical protein Tco_0818721 [Tanacetum coccineum]